MPDRPSPRLLDTLAWGAYLGCSWTWCIGMFLPVLLIADYGVKAWWAFALPNVVGAAAMGWVIRNARHSAQLVELHLPAIHAFSFVTVAFLTFFATWVIGFGALTSNVWLLVVCYAAVVVACAAAGPRLDRFASAVALLISLGLWIAGTKLGLFPRIVPMVNRAAVSQTGFIPLSAVMVFGFLLCPYLDQTFHRARQATDAGMPRTTFALGFGLFFAAMIVFTLLYSGWAVMLLLGPLTGIVSLAYVLISIHILVQSFVTTSMHLRQPIGSPRSLRGSLNGFALIAGFLLAAFGIEGPERTYRLFMSAYGLLFPAYVLICMKPWQAMPRPASRSQHAAFVAAVLLAAPLYWLGFIDGKMFYLFPALAILLIAAAVTWRNGLPRLKAAPTTA